MPSRGNAFTDGIIKMQFNIDSIPQAEAEIAKILAVAIDKAFRNLVADFKDVIINRLLFGGKGWKPLVNTAAWKWLNSPKGYAQLGFTSPATPLKLLVILSKSWNAKVVSRKSGPSINVGIQFNWANLEDIFRATIHPSAGKLNLPAGRSWFEWVYAGLPLQEEGFKFKKTGPSPGVRSSSIAGAEAGRMVAGGMWQVSPRFRVDLEKLWERNNKKITRTIEDYISGEIAREVKV
jgi:hypothetical protein